LPLFIIPNFKVSIMGLFDKNNGQHKGGRLQQVFEVAKPALNLSAQQEAQITEIFTQFREERRELKSGGDNARDEIRTARREAKQKIMAVLNDDQKRILEENLSKWKGQAE